MSYEHKSSIGDRRHSFPWKTLFMFVVFFALIYVFFPSFLPNLFSSIAKPFWTIEKNIVNSDILVSTDFINEKIASLQRENTELKEILGRTASSTIILGYILKKPPFSAYDTFIIDLGQNDGITIGDKVYAIGDILIGEIEEVNVSSTKVKLYSSFGEKYDVFIGSKNIEAVALGRGGGSFEVTLPRDIKIGEGDEVRSTDTGSSIFGIVDKYISDPTKAFSTIFFAQPLNMYEQKFVIIKK